MIYHLEQIPTAKGHAWGIVATYEDRTQFLLREMFATEPAAQAEIDRLNAGATEPVEERPNRRATSGD